jgi:hypothetical protein
VFKNEGKKRLQKRKEESEFQDIEQKKKTLWQDFKLRGSTVGHTMMILCVAASNV